MSQQKNLKGPTITPSKLTHLCITSPKRDMAILNYFEIICDQKYPDQPVHIRSLISIFAVRKSNTCQSYFREQTRFSAETWHWKLYGMSGINGLIKVALKKK